MSTNETTTLLELVDQEKPNTTLGDRSAKRYIRRMRQTLGLLNEAIDLKKPIFEKAVLVGTLLITGIKLMIALRLDPLGCVSLSRNSPNDHGNRMLPMWKEIA